MPEKQTTSTEQTLSKGPKDMPDRGGPKPTTQSTSSMCDMSRTAHPVAAFGAKPGMGTKQTSSTEASLSRTANSPYQDRGMNGTKEQESFPGGRGKR